MFGWEHHAVEVARGARASLVCLFLKPWSQDRGGGVFFRVAINSAPGRQHRGEFGSVSLA